MICPSLDQDFNDTQTVTYKVLTVYQNFFNLFENSRFLGSIHGYHDSIDLRWGLCIRTFSVASSRKPNSNWLKSKKKKKKAIIGVSEQSRKVNFRQAWLDPGAHMS